MENLLSFDPAGDVSRAIMNIVRLSDGCSCTCQAGSCGTGQGSSGGKTLNYEICDY